MIAHARQSSTARCLLPHRSTKERTGSSRKGRRPSLIGLFRHACELCTSLYNMRTFAATLPVVLLAQPCPGIGETDANSLVYAELSYYVYTCKLCMANSAVKAMPVRTSICAIFVLHQFAWPCSLQCQTEHFVCYFCLRTIERWSTLL